MKPGLLGVAFLVFYALIHLGMYLPDLYYGKFSLVDERSYDKRIISLAADLLLSFLFTITSYIALHRLYPKHKYIFLLLTLTVAFIVCFVIDYLGAQWLSAESLRLSRFFRSQVLYNAFYVVFAMVFYFVRFSQFKELQEREMVIQNRLSELSFLRSQINPHFLFNNLNNIYSMVYHKSEQSLPAISGLSELLRYMLYDSSEAITLDKEVYYLEKYIALEQLRFEVPCKINFSYTSNDNVKLAPLLLIPFIENAFKHGAISFEHEWLEISIESSGENTVWLRCINEIGLKTKYAMGGIGIDNVRKRLALLYPNKHTLIIEQSDNKFIVDLSLQ